VMTAGETVRVLLVEDEPKLAFAVQTLLETSAGCELVGTATAGTTAISMCAELRPDVVILDVRLAELDGISAAVEIRRVAPGTRIVIYSGDEVSLQRANDAGFPDTLLKGAIADDLIELVDG
jgi:DNA-binding NarL/FixJ family response regulator